MPEREESPITKVINSVVNGPHCNPVISSYVTILLHHILQETCGHCHSCSTFLSTARELRSNIYIKC